MSQLMEVAHAAFHPGGPVHVVDIGANPIGGDAPYQPLLDAGLCALTCFEPDRRAYDALLTKDLPGVTVHNLAVGDGRTHTLHIYEGSGLTSLFRLRPENSETLAYRGHALLREQAVKTVRLDDVPDIDRIDFLKIDTQGSELMIFENGAARLGQALAMQIELRLLPLYEGEPRVGDVFNWLDDHGFRFHNIVETTRFFLQGTRRPGFNRRLKHQIGDADGFFVRDLMNVDGLASDELMRLGAISAALGQSNLSLSCLLKLIARREADPALEAQMIEAMLAR